MYHVLREKEVSVYLYRNAFYAAEVSKNTYVHIKPFINRKLFCKRLTST